MGKGRGVPRSGTAKSGDAAGAASHLHRATSLRQLPRQQDEITPLPSTRNETGPCSLQCGGLGFSAAEWWKAPQDNGLVLVLVWDSGVASRCRRQQRCLYPREPAPAQSSQDGTEPLASRKGGIRGSASGQSPEHTETPGSMS